MYSFQNFLVCVIQPRKLTYRFSTNIVSNLLIVFVIYDFAITAIVNYQIAVSPLPVIESFSTKFNSDRENLLQFYQDKKRQEERKREWELREKEKATPGQIQEIIDKYSKKES